MFFRGSGGSEDCPWKFQAEVLSRSSCRLENSKGQWSSQHSCKKNSSLCTSCVLQLCDVVEAFRRIHDHVFEYCAFDDIINRSCQKPCNIGASCGSGGPYSMPWSIRQVQHPAVVLQDVHMSSRLNVNSLWLVAFWLGTGMIYRVSANQQQPEDSRASKPCFDFSLNKSEYVWIVCFISVLLIRCCVLFFAYSEYVVFGSWLPNRSVHF